MTVACTTDDATPASDREYRNKVQGFSFYLFHSQQAKCTIWQVSRFYT